MTNEPFHDAHAAAKQAATLAAEIIRANWDKSLRIENKGEVDLVTEIDRAAEVAIVDFLRSRFPHDRFVAEESGELGQNSERCWYIDPLDGTTNFSHGFPHFSTSIALCINEQPVASIIYEPLRDWCFSATLGGGAFLNAEKLSVSREDILGSSLLATGFPYDKWTNPDNNSPEFDHFLRRTRGLRRAGSAALDLAYVASGWLDGYWEGRLSPWDIAAGILLVREAGGVVTDYTGATANPHSDGLVAANPQLAGAIRAELRICREK